MKKLFLLLIFAFISVSIFASPFGLKMGMTLEEVTAACGGKRPERIENDDRYIITPEKSHSAFDFYLAWINAEHGLYRIRGVSEEIETDDYGKNVQNAFYNFEHRLEAIYGMPEITDRIIDKESYYKEDKYWSYSLRRGARELSAVWSKIIKGSKMKDDVIYVNLHVEAVNSYSDEFYLFLDYVFSNTFAVEDQEDEVL
ncbi:MAG: hypothetical protein NC041_06040 [Bacteroides sp.]|nr:hypothetical protein [Prevotella sp.]MCM1407517.1 hypothetical protein [Treponema brennaborense]MCM1470007.1 hypothetical protein [Bacteroides sp.]